MITELQYPIFLDASQYAQDTFWKYVFEDFAYGRTPYGVYITKNFICCNYKDKEFSYKIDLTKSGKQLYDELYHILYNKFGLLSMEDKQILRSKFEKTRDESLLMNNLSWGSIKKKNIKHLLIENFVIEMKKKFNLTIAQTKTLLSYIVIGLIFKTIETSNIDYQDGHIKNIDGFKFDKNYFAVPDDLFNFDNIANPPPPPKKRLSDSWEKYLTNFKKNRAFK